MAERKYPYKAWKLMPSFKPVEVTIVGLAWPTWNSWSHFDRTDKGQTLDVSNLFPSKAAAIDAGYQKLSEQNKDLNKRMDLIKKRGEALEKAGKGDSQK